MKRHGSFSLNIYLNFPFVFHLLFRHVVVALSRSVCRFHIRFIPSSGIYALINLSISKSPPQSLYSLRGLDNNHIITGLDIFCLNRSNILRITHAVTIPWTLYAYKATHKVYIYRLGNLCPGMWEFFLFPGHMVLVAYSGAPYRRLNHYQLLVKYVYVAFVQFLD